MNFPDWNFVSYLANQDQSKSNKINQNEIEIESIPNYEEEQKVFTELELRPKNVNKSNTDQQLPETENRTQSMFAIPGFRSLVENLNLTTAQRNCEDWTYDDQNATVSKNNVIEQPLLSWDLNDLTNAGLATVPGYIAEDAECKFDEKFVNITSTKGNNYEGVRNDYSEPIETDNARVGDQLAEEEFQFPQCIEQQFRELVSDRAKGTLNVADCRNMETKRLINQSTKEKHGQFLLGDKGKLNKSVTKKRKKKADQETAVVRCSHCAAKIQKDDSCQTLDEIKQQLFENEQQCKQKTTGLNKKSGFERNLGSTENLADDCKNLTNNVKIENLDEILTMINPEVDIMGKTFHKIPSTQPIYCDSEIRENENGEASRIRRPMNAFMLWARKYRSLVAKEFNEASNSEISVKLGEIWNELTSEQQRPYFKKAESLKLEHKQNYPNYVYQPRNITAKIAQTGKESSNEATKSQKRETVFATLPPDFGSPFAFFSRTSEQQNRKTTADMQHANEVGSTVVISQDGKEVSLQTHIQNEPHIMTPKPIYPNKKRASASEDKIDDEWTDEQKKSLQNGQESFQKTNNGKKQRTKKITNETEHTSLRSSDTGLGLLRDVMLPRPERTGEDIDLMSNTFSSVNMADLDDFLAGGSTDLTAYFNKHISVKRNRKQNGKNSGGKRTTKRKTANKSKEVPRRSLKM